MGGKPLPAYDGANVQYLDLFPAFLDAQGKKNTACYADGLHLNEKGYVVWLNKLLPLLQDAVLNQ